MKKISGWHPPCYPSETMKKIPKSLLLPLLLGSSQAGTLVESPPELPEEPASAPSFLQDTRFFVNGRLRFEGGDLEGLDHSSAITLRNRFGFETGSLSGFSLLAEGEHTTKLGGRYAAFPGFNQGRTVIADPDNLQLNRLQLAYENEAFGQVTLGRQDVLLDDQRFVGGVGWRQNNQTFDAAALTIDSLPHLTLRYVYLDHVNRIFGTNAPAKGLEEWESESHLINLSTDLLPGTKLTAFAYLLDFETAPAFSSNTYGFSLSNTEPLHSHGLDFSYFLSSAYQSAASSNPVDYDAWYFHASLKAAKGPASLTLGSEILASDDGLAAFQTPLGTNHKFNGFADAFLTIPAGGLRDYYAALALDGSFGIKHQLIYHYFQSDDSGDQLGHEINYVASKKLNEHFTLSGLIAHLEGHDQQGDLTRGVIQLDYQF
ncbi:MAG: hypothetical protein ACQKBY_02370 [Verrucomicrobiales bacterium]